MDNYILERTVGNKVWEIHEVLPYVGDYCADWGRSNEIDQFGKPDIDWFPSPDEWTMVYDWLCDFAEISEEMNLPAGTEILPFFEALAKDYVGFEPNDCECGHMKKYHNEEGCLICAASPGAYPACNKYVDVADVPDPDFWKELAKKYPMCTFT